MNIALIFAGGTGQRMNTRSMPKQFLELHGKPIIIYTLEHFENHPQIDGIVVVCIADWIDYFSKLLDKFHITKVSAIVPGGGNGQESIYNGLLKINEQYSEDSIVLIHDGVRPIIDEEIISQNIISVRKYSSAVTISPATETVVTLGENQCLQTIIDRNQCCIAKAPQSFILKDILCAHEQAKAEGKLNFIDSASLMRDYGFDLHTVVGSSDNIKITTPPDFYIFRALIDSRENMQIMGIR